MAENEGLIVLFGSGETTASGQRIFDWLLRRLPVPVQVAILETPAGFELNSAQVAGRIATFLTNRLQNYRPQVTIVPARKRGSEFSPDAPQIADMLLGTDLIFLGPGSPTYAVRQLQGSRVWHTALANHRQGAALVLASAATVAAGTVALPVYEIYKVGEELHWREGLDLLGPYGLSIVLIPHWNNQDGGAELDTSRCFMGQARFGPLLEMLPAGVTVVGIDEHTALALDLAAGACHVLGKGGVTVLMPRQDGDPSAHVEDQGRLPGEPDTRQFHRGQSFPIELLGAFKQPAATPATLTGIAARDRPDGLPSDICEQVAAARRKDRAALSVAPPPEVEQILKEREAARARCDWATADLLRAQIVQRGWQVLDTREGPRLEPAE